MHTLNYFWFLSLIALTSGCTGTIVTKNLTPAEASKTGAEFNGIISYPQSLFYEKSKTTIRTNKDGKVIAWEAETDSSKKCTPVELIKLVTRTDFNHPRLVSYNHGILEEYTFGVTLTADGALQSINTSSTPDRGQTLSNLTSAVGSAAKIPLPAGFVPGSDSFHPCNDGAVITDLIPYEK